MASLASFASSTSATCSKPSGTASGDVLVALVSSAGSAAAISGWTSQASANYASFYFNTILTKVAGGSEPGSYSVSAGPVAESFIILRVIDADTIAVIDGTPTTNSAAGGNITNASITTTVADSLLVIGATAVGSSIGPDGSMTEAVETGPGSTYTLYGNAATEVRGTAGATGTRTQTGGLVAQCMVAIKGASASVPATVDAPTSTATGEAEAPALAAEANLAVPAATATGTAHAPMVGVFTTVAAPTATATGAAHAPSLTTDAVVAGAVATSTAQAYSPAISVDATVAVPVATATAQAIVPTLIADAVIAAVAATANGQAYAPTVGLFATVQAPTATATGSAYAPTIGIGATVTVPAATATAQALIPFVGVTFTGTAWTDGATASVTGRAAHRSTRQATPQPGGSVVRQPSQQGSITSSDSPSGFVRARPHPTARSDAR